MRKDVAEILDLCKSLGLEPAIASGRQLYKIKDPKTGTILFDVHQTPSDPNWRWNVMRHLRRLGLLRDKKLKKTYGKGQHSRSRKSAIDLDALKRAQDQAVAHGERIPTLDDLEDATEFFTRIKNSPRVDDRPFSEDAQEEVIDIMVPGANAPKIRYIKQRLQKLVDERNDELVQVLKDKLAVEGKSPTIPPGKGAISGLARIAMEDVAPARNLRAWKSASAAQQFFSRFLREPDVSGAIWSLALTEATMDHIEGLKWGEIDESRKIPEDIQELYDDITPKLDKIEEMLEDKPSEPEIAPQWDGDPIETSDDHIRERYAEALLEVLKQEGSKTGEEILNRLDKLSGIA